MATKVMGKKIQQPMPEVGVSAIHRAFLFSSWVHSAPLSGGPRQLGDGNTSSRFINTQQIICRQLPLAIASIWDACPDAPTRMNRFFDAAIMD